MEWQSHHYSSLVQYVYLPHPIDVNNLILVTDVFDGAMVVLAMYTTNILHPGVLLDDAKSLTDYPLQEKTVARATGSSAASLV